MIRPLICLVFFLPAITLAGPEDTVEKFHAALTEAMQSGNYDNRLVVIQRAVDTCFQVHTISRISLGRNWRQLDSSQQGEYEGLIKALVTSTYAARFKEYNGQVFHIDSTAAITKNRHRVKSTLATRTETVSLDYQLQQIDEEWRIYDIIANGVSDLSLKRSNYASLYADGGLNAVTEDIKASIRKNQDAAG